MSNNNLTRGVLYDRAKEFQQDIIELVSISHEDLMKNDPEVYDILNADYGLNRFQAQEYVNKTMTVDAIVGTNWKTGENANMIIAKHLLPKDMVAKLEPYDMGNGLSDAIAEKILHQNEEEINITELLSEEIGICLDQMDKFPCGYDTVPNREEMGASLALKVISNSSFIVPANLVSDELADKLESIDISEELVSTFIRQREDKYDNKKKEKSKMDSYQEQEKNTDIKAVKIENGKRVQMSEAEKEGLINFCHSIFGF